MLFVRAWRAGRLAVAELANKAGSTAAAAAPRAACAPHYAIAPTLGPSNIRLPYDHCLIVDYLYLVKYMSFCQIGDAKRDFFLSKVFETISYNQRL